MDRLISRQAVLDLIADYNLSMGQVVRGIHALPSVNPQETVLDKIRVEIENYCGLIKEDHCRYCSYCNNVMGVREILEILDKYKAES